MHFTEAFMTTINTSLYSGQYYQLGQAGSGGTTSSGTSARTSSANSAAGLSSAYLLDLSPDAQEYLNNLGKSSDSGSSSDSFLLSSSQQKQLGDILAKYQGLPLTQENYDKLQDDLQAAGLSPDQLAAKEKARTFNPTQILLDALSGKDPEPVDAKADSEAQQKKADNFMAQIVGTWQKTAPAAPSADA